LFFLHFNVLLHRNNLVYSPDNHQEEYNRWDCTRNKENYNPKCNDY